MVVLTWWWTFRGALLDFISAGEASLISWELITIFHQYGQPLWILTAYSVLVLKLYKYRWEATACPYSHILSVLKGVISCRHAAARILAQFVGGSVAYRWLGLIWDLGLTPIHVARSYWTSYGTCQSWLAVPVSFGFMFEFTGALISGVFTTLIFDYELVVNLSVHARIFLSSGVTMVLVVISFHHTGGFFQPLLAFARTFGCIGVLREVSILDHIIVYWLGATLGAIVAMYLAQLLKKLISNCKTSKKKIGLRHYKLQGAHGCEEEDVLFEHVQIE